MNINGKHYRTIWIKEDNEEIIQIIDQRKLPHEFIIEDLKTADDVAIAIKEMHVRGAGLIGATAGFGIYLACIQAYKEKRDFDSFLAQAAEKLKLTRPTAVNLAWAVEKQLDEIKKSDKPEEKLKIALETAKKIADEDAENCRKIGLHGLKIIKKLSKKKNGEAVNILTHCNAGWLAFVDYGSALAPVYAAHDLGIKVHVWVDETRPRNQGAKLTARELLNHGVAHHIIADNTGGYLMQKGLVDMCIVGADRVTKTGDVANKIGTYLKAIAAKANKIPFYVALPSSTFDWKIKDGIKEIPIEERDSEEVLYTEGLIECKSKNEDKDVKNKIEKILIAPKNSPAKNIAFDITPAKYIKGLITEKGICKANEQSILKLYPEQKSSMQSE